MLETEIDAKEVKSGMYVCRLDRPWIETPFLLQGFYVRTDKEILTLRTHCKRVFIDVEAPEPPPVEEERRSGQERRWTESIPKPVVTYEDKKPVEEEIEIARILRYEVTEAIEDMMTSVRNRMVLDVKCAKSVASKMTASILRNPDAFMWLRLLKDKDQYTYSHCMDCSALAIAFGRSMGLARAQLEDLGLGALMFDVGKMRLPNELLNKPERLTDEEFEVIKSHVNHSVEIVKETGGFSKEVVSIVASHHERFDGSGYPNGLSGGHIPLLARMAAIVDTYDAITSETMYRTAISAHEAVRRLYEWRGNLFQPELVEQFIQTLGTYPTGSIVELNTGQVAIVISQNRVRRLRPKVMVILDKEKSRCEISPILDMIKETEDEDGNPLEILKVLQPGAYGIDPAQFYL